MAHERVLVIDDSQENSQFVVEYILKPNGYQALTAYDGEEGLKMAVIERPDLILLDMSMPKMDGLEVLKALNEQKVTIPVIMMTFHGSETLAVQVFRLGVKDYVAKPFKMPELLEAIERALSEARLRRERDELTARLLKSNEQLEQRVRELNTLFGIGKSVTSLRDQNQILARLVEAAVYLTHAEEGALLLVDEASNELYLVASRGIDHHLVDSFRWQVEDSLAGQVLTTGQSLVLNGPEFSNASGKAVYGVRASMYVPLKHKGQVQGILNVNNRKQLREFTSHDLRLLSTLADYAAISLENARLFQHAQTEQTKLMMVLNEIEEPVIVISNERDQILLANSAFRRTFGLDLPKIEGCSVAELIKNEAFIQFALTTPAGNVARQEIPLTDNRIFATTLTPILDIGRAIIMQEVTHFKTLEQIKSNFVATVSHDLRTPLISLRGYTEMLTMVGPLTDKQQLFSERIITGIDKMMALVDNLLDLSKIEANVELEVIVVDLGALTGLVVSEFQEQANRKHQKLIYHAPPEPALVSGSEMRLRQVLDNLIGNAIKYTPEKGQIAVLLQVDNGQVLFKVEDNGPGISASDLPFVFDKFFRANNTDHTQIVGTGLGLAICKSIIDKHEGAIWVESEYQRGSVFSFTLPTPP